MKMHLAWIRVTAAAAMTIVTFGGQFAAGQSQYGPYSTTPPYSATQYSAPQYSAPSSPTPNSDDRYSTSPQTSASTGYSTAPTYQTVAPYGVPSASATATGPVGPLRYPTPIRRLTTRRLRGAYTFKPSQQTNSMPAKSNNKQPTTTASTAPSYQPPQYQPAGAQPTYAKLAQQSTGTVTPGVSTAAPQSTGPLPAPPTAGARTRRCPIPRPTASSADPMHDGLRRRVQCRGLWLRGIDGCMDDGSQSGFGGIYGLYMTRTSGPLPPLHGGRRYGGRAQPSIPAPGDIENQSDCPFLVPHWRGGVEVRLGCTFGIGDGCDDCYRRLRRCGTGGCNSAAIAAATTPAACQPCCQQMYAWEVAWWGIGVERAGTVRRRPARSGTFRYYGMVNYAGLEYDDGGGDQPVNTFYNYQLPITGVRRGTGGDTVLAQRVRTNFSCQNLELNILRLPLFTGGCGCDVVAGLLAHRSVRRSLFPHRRRLRVRHAVDDGSGTFDGWGNGTNELFHDIRSTTTSSASSSART